MPQASIVTGIHSLNITEWLAVDTFGFIYKIDTSNNWITVLDTGDLILRGISLKGSVGFAIADDDASSGNIVRRIYKTVDSGDNWTLSIEQTAKQRYFTKIETVNSNIAVVISDSEIYKTLDGGTTWTLVDTRVLFPMRDISTRQILNESPVVPTPVGSINVTSPTDLDIWNKDSIHDITWTSSGISSDNIKIELWTELNGLETIVESTTNDGTYSWTLTEIYNTDAYIVISSIENIDVIDRQIFTYSSPTSS